MIDCQSDKSAIQNKQRGNAVGKGQKNEGSFSNIQSSRRIKLESFSGNKNSKRETTGRLGSIDQSKIKNFPQKQQYRNGRTIQHNQIPKISIKTQQKYLRQQKQHPNSSMTTKPKLINQSPTKHLSPRSYLSPQNKKLQQKSPSKQSGKKIFNTSDERLWKKKQRKGNGSDGIGDGHGYENRGSNCSQLEGEKEGKQEESANFCDYGADTLKLIEELEKMEEEESSRVSDLKNDKKKTGESIDNSRRIEKRQLQSRSLNKKQKRISPSKEKEVDKNQADNESKNHKKNKSSSQHLQLKQKLGNKDKRSEQKTKSIKDQNTWKQKKIVDSLIQNKQNKKDNKLQKQPSKQQQQTKIPINNISNQKQKTKTNKKQENSMKTNQHLRKEQNIKNQKLNKHFDRENGKIQGLKDKDSELLSNVLNKSKSDIRVDDDEDQCEDGNENENISGQQTKLVKDHEISGQGKLQSNNKQYNNTSLNNSNEIQPKNQDINGNSNIKYLKKDIIKPQVSIVAQQSQKNLRSNDNVNIMKLKLANKQVEHEIMSKGESENGEEKIKGGLEMERKVEQKSKQGSQKLLISSKKDVAKANNKQVRQASSTKQLKSNKNQPEHKKSQKKLQSQKNIKGNASNTNKNNENSTKQPLKQANAQKRANDEQIEGSNKKAKEDIINEKKDECLQTVQMLSPRSQLDLKSKQINLKIAASKLENASKKEIKSNKQIRSDKQIKSNKEISKAKQIDLTKASENKQKLESIKEEQIIEAQRKKITEQKGIDNANRTQNLANQTKQMAKNKPVNDSNQVNLISKSNQKQVHKMEDKKIIENYKQSDQKGEKLGQQQSIKNKEEQNIEMKNGNNQLKKPSSGAAIFRKKPDTGDKNLELTKRQSQKSNRVEQVQKVQEVKKQVNKHPQQNKHQHQKDASSSQQKRTSMQDKKPRNEKEQKVSSKSSNRSNMINSKKQQRISSKSSTNRQTAHRQSKKKQQQQVLQSKTNQCKKQEKESCQRQDKDNNDKDNKAKDSKDNRDKIQVNDAHQANMVVKKQKQSGQKKANNVNMSKLNALKTAQKRQSNQTKRQQNLKNKRQSNLKTTQPNQKPQPQPQPQHKNKSNNAAIPAIQPNSAHQPRNSYAESDSDLQTTPNLQHSQAPKEITCISKRPHVNNNGTESGVKDEKLMGKIKEFKDACVNVQMGKMQAQGQGEDNLYSFANITCQPKLHDQNKQSFLDVSHTDKLNNTDFPHQKPIQRKFNTKFSTPPSGSTRAPILSYIYSCTSSTKPPLLPTPYPLSSQPLPFNIKQNYSLNQYEQQQAYKNDAIYKAMRIVLSIDNWLLQRIIEPFLDQQGIGLVWLFCRGCWRCFRSGSYVSESCFFREAIGKALEEFYDGQDSNYVGVQEILRMLTGFRLLQLKNKKKLSQQLQYQLKKGNLIKGISSCANSPIYSITGIQQTKSKQNLIRIRIQENLFSVNQIKSPTSDNIKWIKEETFEKYFQYFVLICYRQDNYWTSTVLPTDYKTDKQTKNGKKGETMVFTMDSLVNAIGSVEVHGQGQFGCKMDLYREIKPKVLKFIGCVNQKNKPTRSTSNPNPTIYFNFSLKGRYYLMLTLCQNQQKRPKINISVESSNKIQFSYLETIQQETLKNKTSQYLEVDNQQIKQMQHSGNKSLNVSVHTNKSKSKNKRDKDKDKDREREYGFGDGRDKESIREEFIRYLITGEEKE